MHSNSQGDVLVLFSHASTLLLDLNSNNDHRQFTEVPTSLVIQYRVWYFINLTDTDLSMIWNTFISYLQVHQRTIRTIYFYQPLSRSTLIRLDEAYFTHALQHGLIAFHDINAFQHDRIMTISNIF